jgi:uncharacterized protein (DUF1778 family)
MKKRPKKLNLSERLEIRLSKADLKAVEKAAKKDGSSVSQWVRESLVARAHAIDLYWH